MGQQVDLAKTTFSYKIEAEVSGLDVSGAASLKLEGQTDSGEGVTVVGSVPLNRVAPVPAEEFPVGCQSDCNSQIVAFYVGVAHLDITVGQTKQEASVPLAFESAFLSPFGSPIVISSVNGTTLTVVTTYTQADIHWINVNLQGTTAGSLDGAPVSGQFTISSAADENLLTGTETESGTMTFSGMSPSSLDVSGSYQGTSTIPATGTVDCSALTGFPGTCTETGFDSQGTMVLSGGSVSVTGSYQTSWYVPALSFTGSAAAMVSP